MYLVKTKVKPQSTLAQFGIFDKLIFENLTKDFDNLIEST